MPRRLGTSALKSEQHATKNACQNKKRGGHRMVAPSFVLQAKPADAPCRNRTYNLVIKSHSLCQLS